MSAYKGGRFRETKEEANRHDALRVMGARRAHSQAAPDEEHTREKDARAEISRGNDVGWNHSDYITKAESDAFKIMAAGLH